MQEIRPELTAYVEEQILPRYAAFDKAHREDHIRRVIRQSLLLAEPLPHLNREMVYVIAAFHDLGIVGGREHHHLLSGRILAADAFVQAHFTPEEIAVMVEAVEDHRASGKTRPRSDYGLVVADADRYIDPESIVRRTVQYGLANFSGLDRDAQYARTVAHLHEKYGPEGYLKVWLPWSDNAERLRRLHALMEDEPQLAALFDRIYAEETA